MSNILAIAHKELHSYFASPIGYVVIGLFALLYGGFYGVMNAYFMQMSLQMMSVQQGTQPVNINEVMLRPLFQNAAVIVLLYCPW